MKTTHRQAARAKAHQRHELFDPGADITPQEHARRKRRAALAKHKEQEHD